MIRQASITVYLSLSMVVILSFVLALLESVRISNGRALIVRSADMAAEMTFSCYAVPMAERYGIFALDGGEEACKALFEKNFKLNDHPALKKPFASAADLASLALTDSEHLPDREWEPMLSQIRRYELYQLGEKGIAGIAGRLQGTTDADAGDVEERFSGDLSSAGQAADAEAAAAQAAKEAAEGAGEEAAEPEPEPAEDFKDPRRGAAGWLKQGIMRLAVGNGKLSGRQITVDDCSYQVPAEKIPKPGFDFMHYSQAVHDLETGQEAGRLNITPEGALSSLILDDYIQQQFKCYTDPAEKSEGRTVLDYEVEYILFGRLTDRENLESTVNTIFFIRLPLNLIYLYVDGGKDGELGRAVAALADTALPVAGELIRLLLMLCWASCESVVDCYALLHGKKVPIFKDAGTWNLSLDQIAELTGGEGGPGSFVRDGRRGLNYSRYLLMLLIARGTEKKMVRMSQLMEKNTRLEEGWDRFSLASCLTRAAFEGEAALRGRYLGGLSQPRQSFQAACSYE